MAETQNSKQNVQAPQAGQTVIVNAIPGQDIVLEAAFDQAEVKMDGGNVIFEFANGGQVVLDFSDIGTAQAPNVVMPDGTILNMEEFLASLGESDVEPAAGPEGGGEGSGGVGEYRDDAGNLIDGVDKLGVLGPRAFSAITVDALEADDLNPLPTAGFVSAAADEDGLVREWFVTPYTGNDDEADGDHPATAAFVKGFLNYDFGGDGPADVLPFTWNLAGLPSVTSQGHTVLYEVTPNGQTLNAYWEFEFQKPVYGQSSDDSEVELKVYRPEVEFETVVQKVLVFSLELTNLETGEYLFTLYRPLDHSEINTEDDIVYNFSFTVTDGSGDPASGGLNLIIDDDSPVARDRSIERMVDEDDILTSLSTGNYPNDGTKDGSKTGYLDGWWFNKGPAIVEGSLKSLVSFGADGPGKNGFSLSEAYDQDLTSKGQDLEYRLAYGGKVLQAYVPGDQGGGDNLAAYTMVDQYPGEGSNDRVVFELWLDSAGNYKFKLFDQLDHFGENDESLTIDLSSAIVATDGDGDSITLTSGFVIKVTDDAPKLVGKPIIESVAENDIDTPWSEGTSPNDGKGKYYDGKSWQYDGSYTGEPGSGEPGPAYVFGSLATAVKFGADEQGSFGFTSAALQKLYSTDFWWGMAVPIGLKYAINEDAENHTATLVATEPDMLGDFRNSSNVVFEFKLNTMTGEYEFFLYDELRHVEGSGESITLNFGSLIEAVDSDGDAISLNGAFEIRVVDDVPAPVINLTEASVTHDETAGLQDPNDTTGIAWIFSGIPNRGDDPDVAAFPIGYAKSDSPVVSTEGSKAGADHLLSDKLELKILESDSGLKTTEGYKIVLSQDLVGRVIGRVSDADAGSMNGKAAFAIALGSDGKLFVVQYLSIYHENSEDPNDIASMAEGKIVVRYTMTDTDGDTRHADADIGAVVKFADDGPSAGMTLAPWLDDEGLKNPDGIPGGLGDVPGENTVVTGFLAHNFGTDGPGSISFASMHGTSGTVGVETVSYSWNAGTNTLLATVTGGARNGFELFKVQVTDPATGAYKVTLLDNVLHEAPSSIVVNTGNYDPSGPVTISVQVDGDPSATLNVNSIPGGSGFGITSTVDGSGHARFDEINYLGDGKSEIMSFRLAAEGALASSVVVDLAEFYAKESGVGDERGSYELYRDGVLVKSGEFQANSASGNYIFTVSGPEGGFDEIRLAALSGSAPGGNDNSDYSVRQVAFNMSDENNAIVDLRYTVTDGDYDTEEGTLRVRINDDMPEAEVVEKVMPDPEVTFEVDDLQASWTSWTGWSGTTTDGGVIRWGTGANQSGYTFAVNDELDDVDLGDFFTIGTFTHNNFPIGSGTSITEASLNVQFSMRIGDKDVDFDHTIVFDHNETPNGNSPGGVPDEITIADGSVSQIVYIDGFKYILNVQFLSNGAPVSQVETVENGDTSFELIGKLSLADDYYNIKDELDVDYGADGPGSLIWTDADSEGLIEGLYGTLKVDGEEYEYTLNPNQTLPDSPVTESFHYTVVDADGDSVSSVLNILLQNPSDQIG